MLPARPYALVRSAVLAFLTAGLIVSATGIASAGPSPSGGTTATTGSGATDPTTPTDPGTPGTTDPTDPGDPTLPVTPTLPVDPNLPVITFTLPQASAHLRYERARLRRREWHAHAVDAVLAEARRQAGKPYVYGAAGPSSFDCSGLVRYVFGHAIGKWLPHNAAAQYSVIKHIKRSALKPGDLVFQESGGYPFHVGIYAGHDKWWHAPHTGDHVRKQRIYRGHLFYGRVLIYPGHQALARLAHKLHHKRR
ncbi:MAG TPA: C40 family peptidase [Mycobacteriales bacterium]|jgi:cell wall-associated NlpC family hydrolase|nr:C40 family peptidase [Mycobacteriales bacterium]